MYRARANCLKLNDRNRHQGGEVGCKLCGANVNLEHFSLDCEVLGEERRTITELQQPYEEDKKKIMGIALFEEEGMEKKKRKDLSYVGNKRKGAKRSDIKRKEKAIEKERRCR